MNYARGLRVLRAYMGLSVAETARAIDKSAAHLRAVERGSRQPSEAMLVVIARVAGLELEELHFMFLQSTDDVLRLKAPARDRVYRALLNAEARCAPMRRDTRQRPD